MKATGVTRKIDELGRVVIPKEIRRNLSIRDGESLEIFTNEDSIILKKHSQLEQYDDISKKLCDLISSIFKANIIITDREKVLATSLSNNIFGKYLNKDLINLIDNREEKRNIEKLVFDECVINGSFSAVPIIASIDSLGLIIIENSDEYSINLARLISKIISEKVNIY